MLTAEITLNNSDAAKDFSKICAEQPFDIDVVYGHYTVDAKSLLGLLSIQPGVKLCCCVHANNDVAGDYINQIKKFLVNKEAI